MRPSGLIFQLVRAREAESMRQDSQHNQLGDSGSPLRDPLRFRTNPVWSSPLVLIESASLKKSSSASEEQQWQVLTNILGLNDLPQE